MISYRPKDWFTFIFRLHKADTFRSLFWMIICIGLYSAVIAYSEISILKISENNHVKNISIVHGLLGFVISLLLVFRTNTAYDRWWEGRRLWGSLVNASRNVSIKLNAYLPKESKYRHVFKRLVPLYANILKVHIRNEKISMELFDDIPKELQEQLNKEKHLPNQVHNLLAVQVQKMYVEKEIDGFQLQTIMHDLQQFTDICGGCERIKNTPIPYSYSVFLKKFIFFYIMTFPFGYVFNLGYIVVPISMFIFYVLASLELIAEEIEDPFGLDENDLPLDRISKNIQKNIHDILG